MRLTGLPRTLLAWVAWPVWVMVSTTAASKNARMQKLPAAGSMHDQGRLELIDTYLVTDDRGLIYALEVWAVVSYFDDFGMAARTVRRCWFRLSDGSRLIKQRDGRFFNLSTGTLLRRSA